MVETHGSLLSFFAWHLSIYCSVPEGGGTPTELDVYDFKGPGVALAMYNVDEVCLMTLISVWPMC